MANVRIYDTPGQVPAGDCISGARVTLRPVTYADTADIIRWRNDPSVRDHFVFRRPLTKQMHEAWLDEQVRTGRVVQWMICIPSGNARDAHGAGSVYLRDIDPAEHTAEYGIFIGEADARGKGYALESARLVLQYAFARLKLQRVGLRVYTANERAKKGYLAAGFREVRVLPGVESTDGSRADMLWMEAEPGI